MDPDVIVVGGGLAGLAAARTLVERAASVTVLEARDRVGGRTLAEPLGDDVVDLGGQWLGPHHARMRKLARELGIATFPQHHTGKKVLDLDGKVSSYKGENPSLPLFSLLELNRTIKRVETLVLRVPLERMPMGGTVKCIAVYDQAFWRDAGFSGEALSDGPVTVVFDDTSHDGKQPALLGFVVGRAARGWSERPAAERRSIVLAAFTRFFGSPAATPIHYVEKDWSDDPWTRGCPTATMPPGTLSRYGAELRAPVGRLHWAGSETSTEWCGYMEGAVASGERAAEEVLARIGSARRPS